jgi:hypothetical protein
MRNTQVLPLLAQCAMRMYGQVMQQSREEARMTLTDHPPLDDVDVPDDDEHRQRWRIASDAQAVAIARRLGQRRAEIERIDAIVEHEIRRLRDWRAAAAAGPERDAAFFEGALIEYRMGLEDQDPDLPKTYRLPGANLCRRKLPDRVEVVDDAALVAWLRSMPDDDPVRAALKVTERPLVSELAKVVQVVDTDDGGRLVLHDGEPVPGVSYEIPGDRYAVELTEVVA